MKAIPYSEDAYRLLHEGCMALSRIEAAGVRVDVKYLDGAILKAEKDVTAKQAELSDTEVWKAWRGRFRDRTNFNSPHQLAKVLFEVMGYKSTIKTDSGKASTSEAALAGIKDPFVQSYMQVKKIQKAGQFLKGIRAEVCGRFLHPFFNLHIARSYRSSSDNPNFQNLPVRNKEMKEAVRRCVIARKGRRIVEIDYGGVEVHGATWHHKDPNMIAYLNDPTKDLHRDTAMELFQLPAEEITKDLRHAAKNKFVFPQFYGDYWLQCAGNLWKAINRTSGYANKTVSEELVRDHLKRKGIRGLGDQNPESGAADGSFEEHVQKVEDRFWNEWLPVYTQWKKDLYRQYLDRGWVQSLSGFIFQGQMNKKHVTNYPVQGDAFHCLLWSMNEIVLREIKKRRMKALIIGQIHDSLVGDVPEEEVPEFCAMVREIMVFRLKEHWPHIITPLDIEIEATPVGGSWVEKDDIKKVLPEVHASVFGIIKVKRIA